MAPTLRSALAVPFVWTSAAPDVVLTFATGTSPVNVTVPSGTYRTCLATSAADFARVVTTAINARLVTVGRSEVFTLTMGADGRYTLASTGTFSCTPGNALKALGFTSTITSALSVVADLQPQHMAFFVSRVSNGWVPRTAMAGAETLAGVGYGVGTGVYCEDDDVAFSFVPPDAATRTGLAVDQTPWAPALASTLGSHAGQWSIRDVLATAQGKTCAAALGNFQTIRTSTSEPYDLVTIPTKELAAPRKTRLRESWDAYFTWQVALIRQNTQTGTRA